MIFLWAISVFSHLAAFTRLSLQLNYILVSVRLHVTGHAPHASHTYPYACNNCSHSQSPMDTHKLELNHLLNPEMLYFLSLHGELLSVCSFIDCNPRKQWWKEVGGPAFLCGKQKSKHRCRNSPLYITETSLYRFLRWRWFKCIKVITSNNCHLHFHD